MKHKVRVKSYTMFEVSMEKTSLKTSIPVVEKIHTEKKN